MISDKNMGFILYFLGANVETVGARQRFSRPNAEYLGVKDRKMPDRTVRYFFVTMVDDGIVHWICLEP